MTRHPFSLFVALVTVIAASVGCSYAPDLVVRGAATVGPAEVAFPVDTALVRADRPVDGRAAGTCTISPTTAGFEASVHGDQSADAPAVRSLTVRDDQVSADIGGTTYTGLVGAGCQIDVLYLDDTHGEFVAANFDCALSAPGESSIQAAGELHFDGCLGADE